MGEEPGNKILFDVTRRAYKILLLENNEITVYHEEKRNRSHVLGSVFYGIVKRIEPSLNAAFIDIGHEKDAFLHYSDLSPYITSITPLVDSVRKKEAYNLKAITLSAPTSKHGTIGQALQEGQGVIVQIIREPFCTKGVRVSTSIKIPGRYLVLEPFKHKVTISKKINNPERERLHQLGQSIKPNGYGLLIRTAAAGKDTATLHQNLQSLYTTWEEGITKLAQSPKGTKLIGETQAIAAIQPYILGKNLDKIIVNDPKIHQELQAYVRIILPERDQMVYLYQEKVDMLRYLNIKKKLELLLSPIVPIKGGGYLIIEHTEALCTIDVNTGSSTITKADKDQESFIFRINMQAVPTIARQVKLLDIGGIIAMDFISMENKKHEEQINQAMQRQFEDDPGKAEIIPLNKFGIMHMTRSRMRSPMIRDNPEACQTCQGTGKAPTPTLSTIEFLKEQLKQHIPASDPITIHAHPHFAAYLQQEFTTKPWAWLHDHPNKPTIKADDGLPITTYQIRNSQQQTIATNPRSPKK